MITCPHPDTPPGLVERFAALWTPPKWRKGDADHAHVGKSVDVFGPRRPSLHRAWFEAEKRPDQLAVTLAYAGGGKWRVSHTWARWFAATDDDVSYSRGWHDKGPENPAAIPIRLSALVEVLEHFIAQQRQLTLF